MGFFSSNKRNDSATEHTTETPLVQRFQSFLDKLNARAKEMYDELQTDAQGVADADTDPFKRSFLQFKAGMIAQFTAIIQKGSSVYQEEVAPKASAEEFMILSQLFNNWHVGVLNMMTTSFDQVIERDLEKEYAEIMKAYEHYKHQFHCRQCGGKLEIQTFYFIATYVSCSYCRTQNTFDPGTKVRRIEHLARPLAELRCRPLYQRHQEHRKQFGPKSASASYKEYAQALIREMNGILPGLETQHQHFYDRLVSEYERFDYFE
ncbi:hypothetical protein SAMN05444682_10716 [Parapedobacter indicus]|uniref:Uncharacterized protein n=2 Tax=Parapedobacter indicus TaxID=1477437 RepID=A0A1I3MWN1_9SPHI|nr:hypothetical protein CLV26_10716 [Parapedobacter indicus]SFJ01180.1 hypothetical protein SAMN05444682_10716 [Parapedobacter indicus]